MPDVFPSWPLLLLFEAGPTLNLELLLQIVRGRLLPFCVFLELGLQIPSTARSSYMGTEGINPFPYACADKPVSLCVRNKHFGQ